MELETILLILAILGAILFLVALWMSYKSWRWHTLLLVGLVFTAGGVTVWLSVLTLKIHQTWRGILDIDDLERAAHSKLTIQFDGPTGLIEKTKKIQEANRQLEFGVENENGVITEPGIIQLESQLAAVLLDRGRLWDDATPLSLSAEDVLTVEFTQPETYRIEKEVSLYIFSAPTPSEGGEYLGVFRVEEVIGNPPADGEAPAAGDGRVRATLVPSWPISAAERNRLRRCVNDDKKKNWRVYDKMPVDRHLVFADLQASDIKIDQNEFDGMDREQRLRKLLPLLTVEDFIDDYQQFLPEEMSVKEFVDTYEDGQGKYPRERIEVLVEFLRDYFPDPDGTKDETTPYFAERQRVWMPLEGAEGTVDLRDAITGGGITVTAIPPITELLDDADGKGAVVELIEGEDSPRYARKLRDYAYLFRDLYRDRQRQNFEISEKQVEIADVEKVIGEKQEIIGRFQGEKERLLDDKESYLREQKIIEKLVSTVLAQSTAISEQLNDIRNETVRLGKQLNTKQLKAVEEIDRRAPDPGSTTDSG